jgi:hypothetical protein
MDLGVCGAGVKELFQRRQRFIRSADHYLHSAVGQVSSIAGETEGSRMPGYEPAEADALDLPGYQISRIGQLVPRGRACFRHNT